MVHGLDKTLKQANKQRLLELLKTFCPSIYYSISENPKKQHCISIFDYIPIEIIRNIIKHQIMLNCTTNIEKINLIHKKMNILLSLVENRKSIMYEDKTLEMIC